MECPGVARASVMVEEDYLEVDRQGRERVVAGDIARMGSTGGSWELAPRVRHGVG